MIGALLAAGSPTAYTPTAAVVDAARFEVADAGAVLGLLGGAGAGVILALLADGDRGSPEQRAAAHRGRLFFLGGLAVALAWLVTCLTVESTRTSWSQSPSAPPGPQVVHDSSRQSVFAWLPPLLIAPGAVLALVQVAASVAGKGRPPPLRGAARWTRRAFVLLLCLLPLLGKDAGAGKAQVPVRLLYVAALATFALWIHGTARLRGPSVRLVLVCALTGLVAGEVVASELRYGQAIMPLFMMACVLGVPVVSTVWALRAAGLGRRELDALGVDAHAAGDLAVAAILVAPAAALVIGVVAAAVGGLEGLARAAEGWLLVPVLTVASAGLWSAAILYLGRRVAEARAAAARARAKAEAEAPPAAPAS